MTDHIDKLRAAFRETRRHHPFTIDAMVVLPDHLHRIWTLPEGDADFATRWRLIKSAFSRSLASGERISESRAVGERGIWQWRYWEHAIRDDNDFARHVDYIHINPVKHRLVARVSDWPYSSFHRMVGQAMSRLRVRILESGHSDTRQGDGYRKRSTRPTGYEKAHKNILLSIEDITDQRNLEREKDELLRQKDVLLDEIQHRVANSLQIIASIIMLKAKSVDSEDARRHLHDAHNRVISVAAVQRHLHASAGLGSMEMLPYLTQLCEALTQSMISDGLPISLKMLGRGGSSTCANAESLGLIVTELVINSLKHAFNEHTKDGRISVAYDVAGTDWMLSVADNGIGKPDGVFAQAKAGLGTGIVKALAKQLDSQVVTLSGPEGTTVTVTHATFEGREARTATIN